MNDWRGLPLVVFGTGGTSKEAAMLIDEINEYNNCDVYRLLGYVVPDRKALGEKIGEYTAVCCDEDFQRLAGEYSAIGAIIPFGKADLKKKVLNIVGDIANIVFPNIVHPSAVLNRKHIKMGKGNVIYAGVSFTSGIEIGDFNLINPNVTIGHDARIQSYCSINPLASISGNVTIMDGVMVGTGANILQQLVLGEYSVIGAGAVVTKDVKAFNTVAGVPAKPLR